ncbi:hypothetical protein [Scytonema millei]|uniref:Uncharacterized protein n=1 Tax=Scytonema millei VB511283 TaxID=1245923 RepID=A0A9X5E572_9CYAN|nr:hypothetical protein [Scytonema millei]NHC35392.1 hypothetical protein [Scytonema millei VB511283]
MFQQNDRVNITSFSPINSYRSRRKPIEQLQLLALSSYNASALELRPTAIKH